MLSVEADVHLAKVAVLAHEFPEQHRRKRVWSNPVDAAARVSEPQLKNILLRLGRISEAETPAHNCFLRV